MTDYQRESFLNSLASKLGRERKRVVTRPNWERIYPQGSRKSYSTNELVTILREQCLFIHTQLIESTPEKLQQTLNDLIASYGGGPVIRSGDSRFAKYKLEFPNSLIWEEAAGREENIRRSALANGALVFADYALAESGTVVVESRPDQGRAMHFLPAHYIAIIEKERLVHRSTQAAADLNRRIEAGEPVGSCINLISGPSNSADIEMQLVVGVHGPLRATYVLI
ncbi:lactate utilization protein C [Paenibacillus sp. CAA11]|uniref:LutC/YkgG family protein n=1 Tax=Paenibacillus sp. CAA11 TaxID=1532905 RepID=UPI000D3D4C50|nr:lactate utilization protein C [Paenibacillus sp. CAA11]AWB45523.1 lactate utilization protein C [Paenibacillus sp. CAA11]